MTAKRREPVVQGIFSWAPDGGVRLLASKCDVCSTIMFPRAAFCSNPDCQKRRENVHAVELTAKGTLWSWTVQVYRAPPPFLSESPDPHVVGMVDTEEGLRVVGLIVGAAHPEIGMPLELTAVRLHEDEDRESWTWAWRPRRDGRA